MEEINFKPSMKIEKFFFILSIILFFLFLVAGAIFIPLLLLLIIPAIMVLISLISVLTKVFTSYTITNDNEIEIKYEFINKSKSLIRIDQITSLILSRSITEKMFGLGTIRFGIFGGSGLGVNIQSGQTQFYTIPAFTSIINYHKIFDELSQRAGIKLDSEQIYKDTPSPAAPRFYTLLSFIIMLVSILGAFITYNLELNNDLNIGISIECILIALIFSLITFTNYWNFRKIKKTRYVIKKTYIERTHKYFFSNLFFRVPINKITNSESLKNVISYTLFKIGKVRVYTGGNHDPLFVYLKDYEKFNKVLSDTYSGRHHTYNAHSSNSIHEYKEEQGYKTKPGRAYYLRTLLSTTIFLLISIIAGTIYTPIYILTAFAAIIFVISNIARYLLYRNTTYEFFDDRVIDRSGILNIKSKEIYFKNIKHIEMSRTLLFDRICKEGTIHIYTAGTGSLDNRIHSLKEFRQVYKELKQEIE